MPPQLPVIYENPRFDTATPTLWPVANRALRAGAIVMFEWGTLTAIEDAPRYLRFATIAIAVLVLAVHESWPWLRMRDKRWYPGLMGALVISFLGICGYALFSEPQPSRLTSAAPPVTPVTTPAAPATPATPATPVRTPLNADEIQYRTDLRKFILSPFIQAWSSADRLALLSMQNSNNQNSPAGHLFGRVIQTAITPVLDPFFFELTRSNIETMDVPKIEADTRQAIATYSEFQGFWLDYQQLTNAPFDSNIMKQWFAADSAAVAALENLKTYPEATGQIKGTPNDLFISSNHKMDAFLKDK